MDNKNHHNHNHSHAEWHAAVDQFLDTHKEFGKYGRPAEPLGVAHRHSPMKRIARFITYQGIRSEVCDGIWDQLADLVEALLLSLGTSARHEWPPALLLSIPDDELYAANGVGLSRSKINAIKGMARYLTLHPAVDDPALPSSEIIRTVAGSIRGVGPFTVASFLIESGRLDVANYHDIKVREGMRVHYKLGKRPTVKQAARLAETWGPHKTVGTKYMFYLANRPPRMPEHLCRLYELAAQMRRR